MKDLNVLISKEEINEKLNEMAERLDRDYEGKTDGAVKTKNRHR